MEKAEIKKILTVLAFCLIFLGALLFLGFFFFADCCGDRCEGYKAQIMALCSAKATEEICSNTGEIDAKMPGNECRWDANASRCVLKSGIEWEKSGLPYCIPKDSLAYLSYSLSSLYLPLALLIAGSGILIYVRHIR